LLSLLHDRIHALARGTQRQKDFLVVESRVIRGIDHEKTELAGVGAPMQIHHGCRVRVVLTESTFPVTVRFRGVYHDFAPSAASIPAAAMFCSSSCGKSWRSRRYAGSL
jgi:hypothetical protein